MKVPYMNLKLQYQALKEEIDKAIARTIENTAFCLGPEVAQFEKDFAAASGVKHAIGVNSGTSALHLAMLALGIKAGDEVITTPYTFAATSWAISYVGAKPVYVDIEDDTFNIDPKLVEKAITPKTKAILPVHLYGHPFDVDAINDICKKHGLLMVEDAAQSHLAEYKGVKIGGFGEMSCFSFYPGKNLGAFGEGGALLTNNDAYAAHVRALRDHGSRQRYHYEEVGYNYRMEGLQAAVLGVKLKQLAKWTEARRQVAAWYDEDLAGADIRRPSIRPDVKSVRHLYVVRHPRRDELKKHIEERGIGCGVHYPIPLHLQECYTGLGYKVGSMPVCEKICQECLSLPIYPEMDREQVKYVTDSIKEFLAR